MNIPEELVFNSFSSRGKYKELLIDYDASSQVLLLHIGKAYYTQVLKKMEIEILLISRYLAGMVEDFLAHLLQFLMLIREPRTRECKCEVYSLDVISITFCRDFLTFDAEGCEIVKKVFLRQSNFEFKRILTFHRTCEADQLFAFVVTDTHSANNGLPTIADGDFYRTPRLNFVDDLQSNRSLL